MDVSDELNSLAKGIPIVGVIAVADESALEKLSEDYSFPIRLMNDEFQRYTPLLSPSLVAVDRKGRLLMILPGLSGQDDYIQRILWELSARALNLD